MTKAQLAKQTNYREFSDLRDRWRHIRHYFQTVKKRERQIAICKRLGLTRVLGRLLADSSTIAKGEKWDRRWGKSLFMEYRSCLDSSSESWKSHIVASSRLSHNWATTFKNTLGQISSGLEQLSYLNGVYVDLPWAIFGLPNLTINEVKIGSLGVELNLANPGESIIHNADTEILNLSYMYPHPHVDTKGRGCYRETLPRYLYPRSQESDYVGMVEAMTSFLSTYNSGSPFMDLARYVHPDWVPCQGGCNAYYPMNELTITYNDLRLCPDCAYVCRICHQTYPISYYVPRIEMCVYCLQSTGKACQGCRHTFLPEEIVGMSLMGGRVHRLFCRPCHEKKLRQLAIQSELKGNRSCRHCKVEGKARDMFQIKIGSSIRYLCKDCCR